MLAKAGKLGAMLLQFPWSFKNTPDDRIYLGEAVGAVFRLSARAGSATHVVEHAGDL